VANLPVMTDESRSPNRRGTAHGAACSRQKQIVLFGHLGAEPPWVAWRLHTLEGMMEPCHTRGSQGSRPRVATRRRRRSKQYASSARCARRSELSTARSSASLTSSAAASSRCALRAAVASFFDFFEECSQLLVGSFRAATEYAGFGVFRAGGGVASGVDPKFPHPWSPLDFRALYGEPRRILSSPCR